MAKRTRQAIKEESTKAKILIFCFFLFLRKLVILENPLLLEFEEGEKRELIIVKLMFSYEKSWDSIISSEIYVL